MKEQWKLVVEPVDCGICDLCALACSSTNYGGFNPNYSAIKVTHYTSEENGVPTETRILPCWHCDDPPCYYACPYDAMELNEYNVVSILDNCVSCMKCVKACEKLHGKSSIFISPVKDRVSLTKSGREVMKYSLFKCNLCGGDPACVKICPRDVIKFEKIIHQ